MSNKFKVGEMVRTSTGNFAARGTECEVMLTGLHDSGGVARSLVTVRKSATGANVGCSWYMPDTELARVPKIVKYGPVWNVYSINTEGEVGLATWPVGYRPGLSFNLSPLDTEDDVRSLFRVVYTRDTVILKIELVSREFEVN